jgi:hypothetical protein
MENFDLRKYLAENKLLKEATEIPDWLKGKLEDVHTKPGQGSIFSKDINNVVKATQMLIDKTDSKKIDQIANSTGTLTFKSPGIGYNLVLPIEDAKQLPNAKQGEVEKIEGPNKIKVPSITTSAPLTDPKFKTDELTIIVRPKKDDSGKVLEGEYIVLSVFPGDPDIPRASEWNGKYAVIIPGQKVNESISTLNEVVDDKKFEEMIYDKYLEMEGKETEGGEEFDEVNEEEPGRAAEIISIEVEKELNKMPNKGEYKEFEIESEVYFGDKKVGFVLIGKYPEGDTEPVAKYDYEL